MGRISKAPDGEGVYNQTEELQRAKRYFVVKSSVQSPLFEKEGLGEIF
jgi:hypothetical protein